MQEPNGIRGKVVVITGASSGIGEATARRLAFAGARVMLAARRKDRLESLEAQIRSADGTAAHHVTDVTDRGDVQALIEATEEALGPVDVLVNNAGLMPLAPLDEGRVEEWDRMIDVNIKGVLYGIAAVLPGMRARKKGHIVNIASVAGHKVFPSAAVYCATKFAVRALSEGLRLEAGPDLRVTIISPGAFLTELQDHIGHDATREAVKQGIAGFALTPEPVAEAVHYACTQPPTVDVNEILIRPTAQPT